jgi:hypothetical protein
MRRAFRIINACTDDFVSDYYERPAEAMVSNIMPASQLPI